jgi:hypothetical protein
VLVRSCWERVICVGSAIVSALVVLPLVPVSALGKTPIVAMNYDAGETVGWPRLVQTVGEVWATLPVEERDRAVVLTANYGQAGAIERYGRAHGLPRPLSGHNAYGLWGPPAEDVDVAVIVGLPERYLQTFFTDLTLATRIDNGHGIDNEDQGAPVWIARGLRMPWQQAWPRLRHLN